MKIFLSHCSVDKDIVRKVYADLGGALCYFDEASFEPTGSIPEEIFQCLNLSTHFVLFASPAAIQSQWVQAELKLAFNNWMRNGIRRAMVFLLPGTSHSDLPEWLRSYLMMEPPSFRHIICRIQSEIDKENLSADVLGPPFYRPIELKRLEGKIIVESKNMPGAVIVYGPDGSGRKSLINELYARQFRSVALRKFLIRLPAYSSPTELHRELVGLTTIATPAEFREMFADFQKLSDEDKMADLMFRVKKCTQGGQCLVIEGDNVLNDDGEIPGWLLSICTGLSGLDYPRMAITTPRRPSSIPIQALDKMVVQSVPDIDEEQSLIIFSWWLRRLDAPYSEPMREMVFKSCIGNPKQLELGAKLLIEANGSSSRIKPYLVRNLESLSRQFIDGLSAQSPNGTLLAFVANAGFVTKTDLIQYFSETNIATAEEVVGSLAKCSSYGFIVEDEVCVRMPDYLVRGARAIGRDHDVESDLKKLWQLQSEISAQFKIDETTSVPVLNEHCLALLKSGKNIGPLFESIILPSQCLQVARAQYDQKKYSETLRLCMRSYESRAALSNDGLLETFRFMGLAAARLGDVENFNKAIELFDDSSMPRRARRISHFLQGFHNRLNGNYDGALAELLLAYKEGGSNDIHVLRELAFIYLNLGDVANARKNVTAALERAPNNHYILELAVRVELIADSASIMKRALEINGLLDQLKSFDNSSDKIYWVQAYCEYKISINEAAEAKRILEQSVLRNANSSAIDILRGRIAKKQKYYGDAVKFFEKAHKSILNNTSGQRKSILPIVCRELIDCTAAVDVSRGVELFMKLEKNLPKRAAKECAFNLNEYLRFGSQVVPAEWTRILNGWAMRS